MRKHREKSLDDGKKQMKRIRLILVLFSLVFLGIGLWISYNALSKGDYNNIHVIAGISLIILSWIIASIASIYAWCYTLRKKMEEIHASEQEKPSG